MDGTLIATRKVDDYTQHISVSIQNMVNTRSAQYLKGRLSNGASILTHFYGGDQTTVQNEFYINPIIEGNNSSNYSHGKGTFTIMNIGTGQAPKFTNIYLEETLGNMEVKLDEIFYSANGSHLINDIGEPTESPNSNYLITNLVLIVE